MPPTGVIGGFLLAGLQFFHSILDSLLNFAAIQSGAGITYGRVSADWLHPAVQSPSAEQTLTNELLGLHTARRGDYRVLFTLDVEDHILYTHRIDHRSDVYKPR